MSINCIIIEDEPLALKRIKQYVEKISYLNLLESFDNGFEAIGFLKKQRVDLLFLDIKMDELTGIQLLESLERKPYVIITTAYSEYALKGYELNVTDYLLKPFGAERFIQAVEKVFFRINRTTNDDRDFCFVKSDYRIEKVFFNEILFIEGMKDYRCIQTSTRKILTSQTFYDLEMDLPKSKFCRVHKSYIVTLNKIDLIERNRIRVKDSYIPISETYKENFYKQIGFGSDGKVATKI
ncbi:LytR/AlgR family response regulator transcription factor [Aurantibacillus circumpalustris]|uniref:LytR/AlgR family response regulator transcription factor n=1 Tax=Aurantibacillus circumpalustris TaxID=3036359 RepID=UPI00295BB934|nr:response regulator transcription factor [Aurantibacillus circumpalustris]